MEADSGELQTRIDRLLPKLIQVHFSGKSASREAGRVLAPIFDQLLAEATANRQALELHFERLEYFNSSTIAGLVQFIRAAQRAGVSVTVVYDAKQKWQAMSFDALKRAMRPFESPATATVVFAEA
jgi:hypothetical protein